MRRATLNPIRQFPHCHAGKCGANFFSTSISAVGAGHKILVLNAGSSTVKFGLFSVSKTPVGSVWRPSDSSLLAKGSIDRIGGAAEKLPGVSISIPNKPAHKYEVTVPLKDHRSAFVEMMKILADPQHGAINDVKDISLVGHRVVHGGEHSSAQIIDGKVLDQIRQAAFLAPLHNPANIAGIEVARESLPHASHVAVFDTAFHQSIPSESFTYALPRDLAQRYGIRRYGFHGTSHSFVLQQAADHLGRGPVDLNLITCHLGNGASMACIRRGRCIDTTMGMTPLEGLVMGTRCGDVDAGAILRLASLMKVPLEEVEKVVNNKSGLLGLCGHSDMRDVERAAIHGDPIAVLAERIFVERVRKYVGAFLLRLDGNVDALVFTAGIGQNSPRIRRMVCRGLHRFGFELDVDKNLEGSHSGVEISTTSSPSKILVIPTDEELSIALQTISVASQSKKLPSSALTDDELSASLAALLARGGGGRPRHLVLPEGEDPRVLAAAAQLLALEACSLTLLGEPDKLRLHAAQIGADVSRAAFLDPRNAKDLADMARVLSVIRGGRGGAEAGARKLLETDPIWFGTMMVHLGKADGMVSGASHTPAEVMRPATQVIRRAAWADAVSSFHLATGPGGLSVLSDCAAHAHPTALELASIVVASAETAGDFGLESRVVLVSSKAPSQAEAEKLEAVQQMASKKKPGFRVQGVIQVGEAVQHIAGAGSQSRPTVFVFADLALAELACRDVAESGVSRLVGPLLQGLRKPVSDVLQDCKASDIVHAALVTCLQAQAEESRADGGAAAGS